MIQFEKYAASNPIQCRTIILECHRSTTASQARLPILNRLPSTNTTDLGHSYVYAKRNFVGQKSGYDKRFLLEMASGMYFRKYNGDYVGGELEKVISTNDLTSPASTGSINLYDGNLSKRPTRTSLEPSEPEHVLVSEEFISFVLLGIYCICICQNATNSKHAENA
ncbi:hypothetical protein ABG067_001081 [Albugo candida]|uniref:Uncharacterized protein n=1 Tax=Albugo candida TaxID=65357 RepID=A0A024GA82_9STRA|nr:unnamed protein product [Albugo candida]|eukprot:CCI43776.1 unnamed protein product [Albugo candida]